VSEPSSVFFITAMPCSIPGGHDELASDGPGLVRSEDDRYRRGLGSRPDLDRRIAVGGLRYTVRNAALKRRMLENPAAKATAAIGIAVSWMRPFARCTLRDVATANGEAPAWDKNSRRRCLAVIPSVFARSSTVLPSSRKPRSMRRSARETVAPAPCHAGVPGTVSGRHRRQGRKPARSAAAAVGKKTTFRDLAGFTGQMGRQ
jgi:hypothetical protein